jgi:hypothetical protein
MKTSDFNIKISSAKLQENLEKQFETKINLGKYDREQLEDIRNKFRTRIFQHETKLKINDLLNNESYQKDKAMLELLNTRIKEMLGEQMKLLRDKIDALTENKKGANTGKKSKGSKPDFLDLDHDGDKKEPMKQAAKDAKMKEGKLDDLADKKELEYTADPKAHLKGKEDPNKKPKAKTRFVPGKGTVKDDDKEIDEAKHPKDCDCQECMGSMYEESNFSKTSKSIQKKGERAKSAAAIAASIGREKLGQKEMTRRSIAGRKKAQNESFNRFKHNVRFVNESIGYFLQEDEEGKAKAITAAGDIVNDYTSWMQRVGQYQTKSMIELADAIRADFGAAEAEHFKAAVGPALSQTLEILTQQREAISNAVAVLAGGETPEEPMGMEPDMNADSDVGITPDSGMDAAGSDSMNNPGDAFAAADASSSNREMRESREQRRTRKLAEAHSIIAKLAQ